MAMKEWFRQLQPVQLYVILFFTCAFFAVEIVASYVTHSQTLLMNAYHMLCNIVALAGCIASIKYENDVNSSQSGSLCSLRSSSNSLNVQVAANTPSKKSKQLRPEKRMMNTFGWARIDIVTMLVCCVLLASFCFSLIVEAVQTLVHIDHLDAMHHPLPVMTIGACGILLNAFCYFLIGGYTFNQGVFLHFTQEGNVILKKASDSQSQEDKAEQTRRSPLVMPKTQGFREMCRDVLGCVLVMVTSCVTYFTENSIAKFVDPTIAILSAVSLFVLSYPYMKESGLILLQTIPNHINIDSLQKELLAAFPDVMNVHDLHVWQLNGEKVVATIHIIYADATVCARISDQITAFFVEQGITHVTIQPEFSSMRPGGEASVDCLIKCRSKHCSASTCCSREVILEEEHQHHRHHHHHHHHGPSRQVINRKFGSKEILPAPPASVDLKRFSVRVDEISETRPQAAAASASKLEGRANAEPPRVNADCCCSQTVDVDVVKSASATSSREELATTEPAAKEPDAKEPAAPAGADS